MKVINLNTTAFEKACISLAEKLSSTSDIVAIIGVRTGGAVVAKIIFQELSKENAGLRYFEAGASRFVTATKNSQGTKKLFSYFPYVILNFLRILEHFIVRLRMRFVVGVERSISLDNNLENYLASINAGKVIIVDDAVDSGATLKNLLMFLEKINPEVEFRSAALVLTQENPLVFPDVCLYQKVLLRFPWSNDYKNE